MGDSARKQPYSEESQVTETTLTRPTDESEKTSIVTGDTFQKVMEKAKETPPVFVLLAGPSRQMGKQWELLKTGMIIGRIMEADIFIDDRSVS
ncbi:MAG: hypothetical protein K2X47_08955, partial [Bdellovibrionales bacterium]|nr:hypothetical protein [Bdellovibrionales bacterium]